MPIVCVSCADLFPTHLSWSLFFQKRRFSIRVYASPDCPLVASFRENIYLYMKTLVPEMRCDANEEENGSKTVGFKSYVYCYNAFFPFLVRNILQYTWRG